VLVCQCGTLGMERLQPLWMNALERLLHPATIILRNDIPARGLEGLPQEVRAVKGEAPGLVEVREYRVRFLADLMQGQKTGWFYDQRDNRALVAKLARGKHLLDMYCHSGGFGIPALAAGATSVTFADRSGAALSMARQACALNGVQDRAQFLEGEAFAMMESLARDGRHFDIVVADPPAFIPTRQDVARGLKGYEKAARLAAALVAENGLLFIASCSHHATRVLFRKAVLAGVAKAGRKAVIEAQTGAAADHPMHPKLPQSEYLKGLLLRLH
jgi:23S rRNA (cytosine1962-C5)-methyltransferase